MIKIFIDRLSTVSGVVFTLFFVILSVSAEASVKAKNIESKVKSYVQNELILEKDESTEVNIREIDPRLQIPGCQQPLNLEAVNFSSGQSNFSVKVSCPATNWFTFVNVSVSQYQPVVVASTVMSPGDLLDNSNLRVDDIEKNRLRGSTFASAEEVNGARLKRRVREGTIITTNMLCFVCKGDRVTISAAAKGLVLKTSGVAMEDGNLGDSIKIENISTDKKIIAKVVSSNEVRVRI